MTCSWLASCLSGCCFSGSSFYQSLQCWCLYKFCPGSVSLDHLIGCFPLATLGPLYNTPLFSTLYCAQGFSMEPQGVCLPLGFIMDLAKRKPKGRGKDERGHQVYPGSFPAGQGLAAAVFLYRTLQVLLGNSLLQSHLQIQLPLVRVLPLGPPGIRVVKTLCYS